MINYLSIEEIIEINNQVLTETNELEREFFRITCIEEEKKRSTGILKIMNSHYEKYIEKWLHKNFIEK